MRNTSLRLVATGAGLAAALGAMPARAGGFYLQEQSARGAGRAYSGEVADQGAESLWWNPAAIGGLAGGSAAIGVTAILPRATVANLDTIVARPLLGTGPVGGDQSARDPIHDGAVPTGAIAHDVGHRIAVGLAVTAPFNFTSEYPASSFVRYSALTTRLRTFDIQPTVAIEPVPGLSLGAALNIERTTAALGNALPNLLGQPDGSQNLTGRSWDFGYSLGAQYRRGRLSLGAGYKSAIDHYLVGRAVVAGLQYPLAAHNGTSPTTAAFTTPWQASGGARLAVSGAITLDAQVTRFGWSRFDRIALGAPLNLAIPEHYRDSWSYAIGADIAVSPAWTLRAGVQRDLTPVRQDQRDARVPDSDRWTFAVGATRALAGGFKLDAGFDYLTLASAPIDRATAAYPGTPAQTPILMNGVLTGAQVFVASLGGRLGF